MAKAKKQNFFGYEVGATLLTPAGPAIILEIHRDHLVIDVNAMGVIRKLSARQCRSDCSYLG